MKIHIFKDEHVYILALLDFLRRNFDLTNHLFIFQCHPSGKPLPVGQEKVLYLPGFRSLPKIKQFADKSECVYFHLLPMGPVIFFWCLFSDVFQKAVWIFWGADVYTSRRRFKSIKHFIYFICQRKIIRKLPFIAGFLQGDFNLIKNTFHPTARYIQVLYPIPGIFPLAHHLNKPVVIQETGETVILLGNSGSESNYHLEALRLLTVFRHENISILCPLSYGAKRKNYVTKVIREGNRIFGSKFIPLTDFMEPELYNELLHKVDVAVMNHDRQQGLGNIITLLYMGKKVYIRPDTTSYSYFKEKKISVFEITEINNCSFSDFIFCNQDERINNKEIIRDEFSEQNYINKWNKLLYL